MHYTLSTTLQNWKPLNQRIFQINDTLTFAQLAQIICNLYGLTGEHLWEFRYEDTLIINHPEFAIPQDLGQEFDDPEFDDLQGIAKNVSSRSYTLSDYFTHNKKLIFVYDFGETWTFDIQLMEVAPTLETNNQEPIIVSGTGSYLLDDSGGPTGLKEYLNQYARQQRDGDRRETWDDFAEWIQPATRQFKIKNHPEYISQS